MERVGTQRKEKWAPPRTPVELQQLQNIPFLRFNDTGCFFYWSAPKIDFEVSDYIENPIECQNFLRVCHLVIFRADQSKNHPVYIV